MSRNNKEREREILTALENQVVKSSEQISYLNITYPKNLEKKKFYLTISS